MHHSEATVLATELDRLYSRVDTIYPDIFLPSGISGCAYWLMYALYEAGEPMPLRELRQAWCYSKQTVSSALRTLEKKGLVSVRLEADSSKNKTVELTPSGKEFGRLHVEPTMRAEETAFDALDEGERAKLVELLRRYADALEAEKERMQREGGAA